MFLKINIRFLNWFLVIQFIALTTILILIEGLTLYSLGELPDHPFFTPRGSIAPDEYVTMALNGVAMIIFFYDAKKYAVVQAAKKDGYLASVIFFSMIYQGISRLIEFQNFYYSSGFGFMDFVIRKYYFPLDILGTMLFAIVVFEVFMRPRFDDAKAIKISNLLFIIALLGDVIGILTLFFPWFSPTSPFIVGMLVLAITVYSIIVIIYLFIIHIIATLYRRKMDTKNQIALVTIMLQLLVFLAVHIFLIFSETGESIGLSAYTGLLRAIKALLYCGLSVLYYLSFVKPSMAKQ